VLSRSATRTLGVLAALAFGALASGCGKPVLRLADASLGDYYTEEEYRRLRDEQRAEYCRALAEQDSIYRETIAQANAASALDAARAATLRAQADSIGAVADSLERVLALAGTTEPAGGVAPAAVTVREGDSHWRLSGRADIYGDPRRWPRLYEANRDRIRDADLIYPGQELRVPR
jgi:nucleoid-associated protein YgaU